MFGVLSIGTQCTVNSGAKPNQLCEVTASEVSYTAEFFETLIAFLQASLQSKACVSSAGNVLDLHYLNFQVQGECHPAWRAVYISVPILCFPGGGAPERAKGGEALAPKENKVKLFRVDKLEPGNSASSFSLQPLSHDQQCPHQSAFSWVITDGVLSLGLGLLSLSTHSIVPLASSPLALAVM